MRLTVSLDLTATTNREAKYLFRKRNYTRSVPTIRFGKNRMDEMNAGNAVLVLYEWTRKPFCSKTRELFRFDKDSGIGVQKLIFLGIDNTRISRYAGFHGYSFCNSPVVGDLHSVSRNDGLSKQDFRDWFKGCKLSEPMAIIHFTNFRY